MEFLVNYSTIRSGTVIFLAQLLYFTVQYGSGSNVTALFAHVALNEEHCPRMIFHFSARESKKFFAP